MLHAFAFRQIYFKDKQIIKEMALMCISLAISIVFYIEIDQKFSLTGTTSYLFVNDFILKVLVLIFISVKHSNTCLRISTREL